MIEVGKKAKQTKIGYRKSTASIVECRWDDKGKNLCGMNTNKKGSEKTSKYYQMKITSAD